MSERISRIDFVKRKYRLDELCFIDAESSGVKIGHGKVMADETLQRFVDSDPSGTGKYLDWMLFMAGGGQEAMAKSIRLWEGETEEDPNALRNQCHRDFVAEQMAGYTDENHAYHPAVSTAEAENNWIECEERCRFEFLMGDQDIALEDGYGFFRHWPGKNGIYEQIASAVHLWHNSQQKFSQQNQLLKRVAHLHSIPISHWTKEDRNLMASESASESASNGTVDLNIYAGWKPGECSQLKAHYKTLDSLLKPLADIRRALVLLDERFDLIYEDEILKAICPLTVGASLRYGCVKWCISSRTDFDKSFDANCNSPQHWKTYAEKGPLVFLIFKIPVPIYCHKIAIQLLKENLGRYTAADIRARSWYDAKNDPDGVTSEVLLQRFKDEHRVEPLRGLTVNEKALAYGDRSDCSIARAWEDLETGDRVLSAIDKALVSIAIWAKNFDCTRVVTDYLR